MRKIILSIFLVFPIFLHAQTDDTSLEIGKLKDRIDKLEKELLDIKNQLAEEAIDADLQAELQKELTKELNDDGDTRNTSPTITSQSQIGKNTNPAIGVIGDFLGIKTFNENSDQIRNGFTFEEAEISFRMVIDPYARADFYIAVVPTEEITELEEGYIILFSLPYSLQLKAGKFRSSFGKLNPVHLPETFFTDNPPMLLNFFGEEGLVETGVSISALIPNPWDQFIELKTEVTNGTNDESFNKNQTNDLLYLGHLRSFWDITDNSTFELGFTGMTGVNDKAGSYRSTIEGINVIYRWKPLRLNRYKSFLFQAESLFSQREIPSETVNSIAYYLYSEYQLKKRWFLGGRYDYSEFPEKNKINEKAFSGILTFWPTEFQQIRLQYRYRVFDDQSDDGLFLQWTFIIGAHGAHAY